jgi:hypothetical protein
MKSLSPNRQDHALASIISFLFLDLIISALFSSLSIFLVGAIGTVLVFLLRPEVDGRIFRVLFAIKILTLLSVLLTYYNCESLFSQPYYIGGSDDLHSETDAYDFVKYHYKWPWDWPMLVKDKGFIWILAYLIKFTGVNSYHTVAFRVLNEDVLIATAVLCYRISKYRFDFNKKQAVTLLSVVALFPNSLYLSSFVFRDTICAFLMLLVFVLCDDFFRKKEQHCILLNSKLGIIILIASDLFLSFWLRPEALLFDLVIIGLSVLRDKNIKGKNIVYIILSFALLLFVFNKIGAFDTVNDTIEVYSEFRLDETSNSNNVIFKLIFTLPLLPFGIILRFIWGLLSPFPTQIANIITMFTQPTDIFGIIVAIGMIPYYFYMPFLFKNIISRIDKYLLTFLVIFGGYIISTFTFRHVLLFYPFLWLILTRNYYKSSFKERITIKHYSLIALLMLPFLYLITKIL